MQKILLAAAALSLVAAPAFAQSNTASSAVTLTSSVDKLCGQGDHISGGDLPFDATHVVDLANNAGQFIGETGISLGFGNMWCNAPASVTVTASPLKSSTPVGQDDGSFTNSFDLRVNAGGAMVYVGPGATVTTNGADASVTGSVAHAFETGTGQWSKVNIDVLPNAGNRRAVAGTYAGSVTFTVTAN